MSADPNWSPAMARQDISDQLSDANDAANQQHDPDHYDNTPTRAEIERDNWDDWAWWREQGRHN